MAKRDGIAVAGTVLVDRINEIGAYPASGELTKILNVSRAVGGCVPNVGIDIKRFDPSMTVKGIGKIGNDADGQFLLDVLTENGVDTSGIVRGELPTSFTDVMSIKGGQRTFFTYPGACADFGYDDVDIKALDVRMLHLAYFLLLDKIDAGDGERILKDATEAGIETSIDLVSENSDRYNSVIGCLKYTDNVIINEFEAGMIAGIEPCRENLRKIAETIMDMGVRKRVIIHMPEVGVCLSNSGYAELESCALPEGYIKGKTGAGDAFCAGALIGIYRGYDDLEVLRIASKAATLSLSGRDAISGMMSEADADKLFEKLNIKI
jgi:sugar/nucleoside kinase (ribokinase family)